MGLGGSGLGSGLRLPGDGLFGDDAPVGIGVGCLGGIDRSCSPDGSAKRIDFAGRYKVWLWNKAGVW